jgi:hypothetical protein
VTEAEQQGTLLMGIAAGLEVEVAQSVAGVEDEVFTGWLDDEDFKTRLRSAQQATASTELAAANRLRKAATEDPAGALRWLLDKQAARELERVKELTTY